MKRLVSLITAIAIGTAGAVSASPVSPPDAAVSAPSGSLDAQVDAWIAQLSQEEAFASWKGASWHKYPLGPGLHGWVVIMYRPDGGEAGYLIVSESPDGGYVLSEYGLGDHPLFSWQTLEQSPALTLVSPADKTERMYYDSIHSFWKVTDDADSGAAQYFDAVTGMELPVTDEKLAKFRTIPVQEEELSGKRLHTIDVSGDPYMSLDWLDTPPASIGNWKAFIAWLDAEGSGNAVYIAKAFEGFMLTPMGVAGYHWWPADGTTVRGFVALDQEGLRRYIPLERLLADGTFH